MLPQIAFTIPDANVLIPGCIAVIIQFSILIIEYSYNILIGTLAAVERDDAPAKPDKDQDPDPVPGPSPTGTPLTSSLHKITTHLRAQHGRWFFLRGAHIFTAHTILAKVLLPLVLDPDSQWGGLAELNLVFGFYLSAVWQTAWVDHVLAQPGDDKWFIQRLWRARRRCGWREWGVICLERICAHILPTFLLQVQALLALIAGVNLSALIFEPRSVHLRRDVSGYRIWAVKLLPQLVVYMVTIPLRMIAVRMAAAKIAAGDGGERAIVALDSDLTGPKSVGVIQAWRSFKPAARVRVWKVLKRVFWMVLAISLFGQAVLPNPPKKLPYPLEWFAMRFVY